ncbi:MAG TPA: hypothetical protein VLH77_01525, partial [Gammaproteobacteria bacterium]|nr:hypothetical protein [Gammaproteobacteria bacterium]
RCKGELWYINKDLNWFQKIFTSECRLITKDLKKIARLDVALKTVSSSHKHLSDKEIDLIGELTDHTHRTFWQQFLHYFGYICTAIMAIGCAVSTTGTFLTLNLATGGLATIGALVVFVSGAAANWLIFKRAVSPVLIDLFARENFLVDEDNKDLKLWKKIAIGMSVFLSLSVGVTFGALTYANTFQLPLGLPFLAVLGPAFPYIAVVLAGVTLVCMTALMLIDIAILLKKKDIFGECWTFIKNLFNFTPDAENLPQNANKNKWRIILEHVLTILLIAAFLPLAGLGLYMTMAACTPDVKAILLEKIPHLSAVTAGLIAEVTTEGVAFVGQIAFGVKAAVESITKGVPALFQLLINSAVSIYQVGRRMLCLPKPENTEQTANTNYLDLSRGSSDPTPQIEAETILDQISKAAKQLIVACNAASNGLIALKAALALGNPILSVLAFISATANSEFAGTSAIFSSEKTEGPGYSKDDLYYRRQHSSTLDIVRATGDGKALTYKE